MEFRVSVIIPVYNSFSFLDRSIQSALDQSQTGEVILIDDRSNDGSWEKCQNWLKEDSRVKILKNEGLKKGAGVTRNLGIINSNFQYIAFLDSDDYYLKNRFAADEILFRKNSDIDGVYNSVINKVISGDNIKVSLLKYWDGRIIGIKESFKILKYSDILGCGTHLNGLTIKKSSVLLFDEELKQTQDVNFFLKLFTEKRIINSHYNNIVATYTIHSKNTISNTKEAFLFRRIGSRKNLIYSFKNSLPCPVISRFFKDYLIYDYLIFQNFIEKYNKLSLILFAPLAILRMPFNFKDKLRDI